MKRTWIQTNNEDQDARQIKEEVPDESDYELGAVSFPSTTIKEEAESDIETPGWNEIEVKEEQEDLPLEQDNNGHRLLETFKVEDVEIISSVTIEPDSEYELEIPFIIGEGSSKSPVMNSKLKKEEEEDFEDEEEEEEEDNEVQHSGGNNSNSGEVVHHDPQRIQTISSGIESSAAAGPIGSSSGTLSDESSSSAAVATQSNQALWRPFEAGTSTQRQPGLNPQLVLQQQVQAVVPYTPHPPNILRNLKLNEEVKFREVTVKRKSSGSRRISDGVENQRPTADVILNEAFKSQNSAFLQIVTEALKAQNRAIAEAFQAQNRAIAEAFQAQNRAAEKQNIFLQNLFPKQ